jgi:hypothetical protein
MSRKIFGHEIQHRTRIHKDLRHTVYSDFLTVLTRQHVDTADGVGKLLTAEESSGKARPIPIAVGRATCVASTCQESTTSSTKLTDRFCFPFPFAGLVRSCTSWRATSLFTRGASKKRSPQVILATAVSRKDETKTNSGLPTIIRITPSGLAAFSQLSSDHQISQRVVLMFCCMPLL